VVEQSGSFVGKCVIVTGGSQGVGLGISRAFLQRGASVVSCARKAFDCSPAATTDDERARSVHVQADIRDDEAVDAVIAVTLERFGRLDVLVNNAGGQPPADIATASPRFIRAIIDLNLTAPMVFAAKAYRVMTQQETGGCIVNISSQASLPTGSGGSLVPYGAAKAGLNHMTRSLAVAWGRKVRVNCIALGWVETEAMADLLLPENREQWSTTIERIPVGRMGTTDEIGRLCTFLASDEASYLNGTTIWADGGGT
jgi:NAD(P)-dependent dehydrogenase (short-subunit alcohol dehydrogenase family)